MIDHIFKLVLQLVKLVLLPNIARLSNSFIKLFSILVGKEGKVKTGQAQTRTIYHLRRCAAVELFSPVAPTAENSIYVFTHRNICTQLTNLVFLLFSIIVSEKE